MLAVPTVNVPLPAGGLNDVALLKSAVFAPIVIVPGKVIAESSEITGVVVPVATSIWLAVR